MDGPPFNYLPIRDAKHLPYCESDQFPGRGNRGTLDFPFVRALHGPSHHDFFPFADDIVNGSLPVWEGYEELRCFSRRVLTVYNAKAGLGLA